MEVTVKRLVAFCDHGCVITVILLITVHYYVKKKQNNAITVRCYCPVLRWATSPQD